MKMIKFKTPNGFEILRQRLGLTQKELAIRLNVSRSLVCMVEKNQRNLPTQALIKLAHLEIALQSKELQEVGFDPHELQPSGKGSN